jgi:type I restriction enzyme M protein
VGIIYQGRVVDKYSCETTLEEIAENDYNLNIPCYVYTVEEEDPVDLTAVAGELKAQVRRRGCSSRDCFRERFIF